MKYSAEEVEDKYPLPSYFASLQSIYDNLRVSSIWSDRESERVFVGFNSGAIAVYDKNKKQPIVCFRAAPHHNCKIEHWDGSILIVGGNEEISLFDFLSLG